MSPTIPSSSRSIAAIHLEPIGVIRSLFTEESGTPIQPATAGAVWGAGRDAPALC